MKELIEKYREEVVRLQKKVLDPDIVGTPALVARISLEMAENFIQDLSSLQSKGKTKEEVALQVNKFIHEQCVDGVPHDIGWNVVELMEEYAQSHADQDGCKVVPWQCCPICNGSGQMYEPLSTGTFRACPTCNGQRIIPMHVTPPQP